MRTKRVFPHVLTNSDERKSLGFDSCYLNGFVEVFYKEKRDFDII